jgi:hypothetical protein
MVAPVLIRLPDVSALDGYTQFGMASFVTSVDFARHCYDEMKRGKVTSGRTRPAVSRKALRCELCEQHGDELDVEQKVIQSDMLIGTMHARPVVCYPCSIDDRQAVAQAQFLHRT